MPSPTSSAQRVRSASTLTSCASSLRLLAIACSTAASNGRGSIWKRIVPALTSCPSTKSEARIWPSARLLIVTRFEACTEPMPCSRIGTSAIVTVPAVTGTPGGAGGGVWATAGGDGSNTRGSTTPAAIARAANAAIASFFITAPPGRRRVVDIRYYRQELCLAFPVSAGTRILRSRCKILAADAVLQFRLERHVASFEMPASRAPQDEVL